MAPQCVSLFHKIDEYPAVMRPQLEMPSTLKKLFVGWAVLRTLISPLALVHSRLGLKIINSFN